VRLTTDALLTRGRCAVALSGGSTPRSVYQLLAAPAFRGRVRWSDIQFFWGDERHVPPDHRDSNYRMAVEAMLSNVPVPPANVHRMRGEVPAELGAREYDGVIRECVEGMPVPRFDVIHLGLGTDGHTASLFPGTAAIEEQERVCVANWVTTLNAYRITMTLPILNAARAVVFIAAGAGKSTIVQRVLRESAELSPLPAQRVRPSDGELWWMLDQAAAGELT